MHRLLSSTPGAISAPVGHAGIQRVQAPQWVRTGSSGGNSTSSSSSPRSIHDPRSIRSSRTFRVSGNGDAEVNLTRSKPSSSARRIMACLSVSVSVWELANWDFMRWKLGGATWPDENQVERSELSLFVKIDRRYVDTTSASTNYSTW